MSYDANNLVTLGQLKVITQKVASEDEKLKGNPQDTASDVTIYGSRALASTKLMSVHAENNGIEIVTSSPGSIVSPYIGIKLSPKTGNILNIENSSGLEGLYATSPPDVVYTIVRDSSPSQGMFATYHLTANGDNRGAAIDIPKDFVVKSASLETVVTPNVPYTGAMPGDKYIDFVINTLDASENEQHLYLPVNDLVDTYSGSYSIDVDNSHVISLILDSTNLNGLEINSNGLKLNTVISSTSGVGGSNGAMTAVQSEKLDNIAVGATKVESSSTNGYILIDNTETPVYSLQDDTATSDEFEEMLDEIFPT